MAHSLLGHLGYRKEHLDELVRFVATGRLDVSRSVSEVMPLEEVRARAWSGSPPRRATRSGSSSRPASPAELRRLPPSGAACGSRPTASCSRSRRPRAWRCRPWACRGGCDASAAARRRSCCRSRSRWSSPRSPLVPATADALTWVALVLVPPGCALALGWAARGARPWAAVLAVPLLALAWARPDAAAGQLATVVLIAGSAITLGRLLAGAVPLRAAQGGRRRDGRGRRMRWCSPTSCRRPTRCSSRPRPARPAAAAVGLLRRGRPGLRRLLRRGGRRRDPRRRARAAALGRPRPRWCSSPLAWDQLFLVYDVLPATVPPALVLLGVEAWRRRAARRRPHRVLMRAG